MNVLLYCNTQAIYREMEKSIKKDDHIVLVSTNIGLLNSQCEKVTGVILDSENTFFSKESFGIIEKLNQSIKKAIDTADNYLYEVPLRIEGGLGNRIQSFLYVIDIFQNIVRNYHIQKVCYEEVAGNLESKALLYVVKSCEISVQVYNNNTLRERISNSANLPLRALKTIYSNISTMRRIRTISSKCNKDYHKEWFDVGFVLLSSRKKYVNWSMKQMSFYDKEVKTAIFCYQVEEDKDIDVLQNMGKTVKFVEAYGDWTVIIKSYWSYLYNKRRIQKEIKKTLEINKITFQNIDITTAIFDFFQAYIGCEKLDDVIYDNMVGEFITHNRFKLLTGNGDSNFISNKSFYFHAKKLDFSFWGFKDSTQTDVVEFPAEWIALERYPFMWRFVFVDPRKKGLEQLENAGWEGDVYIHSNTTCVKRGVQKKSSNENIAEGGNILWAPSYPMYGVYSTAAFMEDNRSVIENLNKFVGFLRVKYHFSQDEEQIKMIQSMCRECRVEWIDRKEAIESYIEWADIVFTTLSTVIKDCMLQNKFVVCIADNLAWNYVGDLKDYCYMVSREEIDYERVLYDIDFRKQWIRRQNEFMDMMTSTTNDVSMVEVLNDYINRLDEQTNRDES